jgi:hypothetical protein
MKTILHLALAILTCAPACAVEIETAAAQAQRIEIPRVNFRETTLREACEFLSQKSWQLSRKRVNIIIAVEVAGRIVLNVEKQPLLAVLREAAGQVGCEVQAEPYALVIREKGAPKLPAILETKEIKEGAYRKKLDQIVVPVADLRDCTVHEALEFLVQKSRQLDPQKGGGIGLNYAAGDEGPGPAQPVAQAGGIPGLPEGVVPNAAQAPARGPRITLRVNDMPILELYRYTAGLAGLEMELDKYYRVNIHPPKAKPQAR